MRSMNGTLTRKYYICIGYTIDHIVLETIWSMVTPWKSVVYAPMLPTGLRFSSRRSLVRKPANEWRIYHTFPWFNRLILYYACAMKSVGIATWLCNPHFWTNQIHLM